MYYLVLYKKTTMSTLNRLSSVAAIYQCLGTEDRRVTLSRLASRQCFCLKSAIADEHDFQA